MTNGQWLEHGITSGDVLLPGSDLRKHIHYFVRSDRDGLMTRRLLTFTTDSRAAVRQTTFELLDQLCLPDSGWPVVAGAAEPALSDVDPRVRRTAATLLVHTAEPDRAVAALTASTDPVVRTALVETMPWHKVLRPEAILERLRSDPVSAVRLLASIAMLTEDDSAAWPALDAAIRADLEACAGVPDTPGFPLAKPAGQHWAGALIRIDREETCCAWARRLADPAERPEVRREGVRMAVAAMRAWRAAPGRVTLTLTALLKEEPSEVRSAALHALAASLTASRLAADDLAAVLDDPHPGLGAVAAIALGSIGDHRAVPHLVRLMLSDSTEPRLAEAFRAVARAGADPGRPVAAARQILAALPDSCAPELPIRVLAAFGPGAAAAVPELITRLGGGRERHPGLGVLRPGTDRPGRRSRSPAAAGVPDARRDVRPAESHAGPGRRRPVPRPVSGRTSPWPLRIRAAGLARRARRAHHPTAPATTRQHRQLRSLFKVPGFEQVDSARVLRLHDGPAVAAELLEVLPKYLSDDLRGPEAFAGARHDGLACAADPRPTGPDYSLTASSAVRCRRRRPDARGREAICHDDRRPRADCRM